jgi:hypothetical protein
LGGLTLRAVAIVQFCLPKQRDYARLFQRCRGIPKGQAVDGLVLL